MQSTNRGKEIWETGSVKILIVEDEVKTGDYLRMGLQEAGFNVDLVRDGKDGLHLATTGGLRVGNSGRDVARSEWLAGAGKHAARRP